MKKICLFSGDISRSGGTERVTALIANSLVEKGFKIFIVSIVQKKKETFFEFNEKIQMNELLSISEESKFKQLKIIFRLRKYLSDNNIDILIDVDTILDIYSIPAVFLKRTKVISWEHFNYYENLGSRYRDWGRVIAAKFSNAIVTITKEDQGYFINNMKPKCPVKQIYNPLMLNRNDNHNIRNFKTLLSAGRLTYQKGFDILLDVAQLVFEKHPEWQWIILGEGEDREMLEGKIQELDLSNNVILKGNVSNIEEYYMQSDIFVLTSRYEGFGLVLTEAKSYGLPCVSFKCKAGPSEIILDGINGYLVDCFDVSKMAEKINNLIMDDSLRENFSDKSLLDTDKFEIENVVRKWIDLIENI